MSTVTIAVDLAKNVFELAGANAADRIVERRRLSRAQFERFWDSRERCRVAMEACGGAHHWARWLVDLGFEVVLLPPQYVRPYVRRDKTDRTDCEAILEALRCAGIHPVSIKSEAQQSILALHSARSQWMRTRAARIIQLRALLTEFGVSCAVGSDRFLRDLPQLLEAKAGMAPAPVRRLVLDLWEEVRALEVRVEGLEQELKRIARAEPTVAALQTIPGVGLLTATALFASVGNIHSFRSGRQLASWLGLTPREHSSGGRRRLGRISKRGDVYLRTLLVHGARCALLAAERREKSGQGVTRLQAWAVKRGEQKQTNQAAVALANKLARVVWAVWKHERSFDGNYADRMERAA